MCTYVSTSTDVLAPMSDGRTTVLKVLKTKTHNHIMYVSIYIKGEGKS